MFPAVCLILFFKMLTNAADIKSEIEMAIVISKPVVK